MRGEMDKYRGMGLKLTPQRLAVLHYLDGNTGHPSAEDIYRSVSKKYPTMSLATVYNTLEALKQRGHLRELTIDPSKKRFDPNPRPHHHLMCVRCNKTLDIRNGFRIHLSNRETQGFQIIGHHIEFYGLCLECQKEGSALKQKKKREDVRHV